MKNSIIFGVAFMSFLLSGCAIMDPPDPNLTQANLEQPVVERSPDFYGKIVDADRFKQGGILVVVPFNPGKDVFADAQFDKIALKIVKGLADVLQEKESSFKLVFNEDAESADLILSGHILDWSESSGIKKLVLGSKKKTIDLRAKLIDKETQNVVAVFEGIRSEDTIEIEVLAYMIGEEIGRFLVGEQD